MWNLMMPGVPNIGRIPDVVRTTSENHQVGGNDVIRNIMKRISSASIGQFKMQ